MKAVNKEIFAIKIEHIITLLEEAGYEPYSQLKGYVELGNSSYITRHGNAREKVKELDIRDIKAYLDSRWTCT